VCDEQRELDRGEMLSLKKGKRGFASKEKQTQVSCFGPQFTEHFTFGIDYVFTLLMSIVHELGLPPLTRDPTLISESHSSLPLMIIICLVFHCLFCANQTKIKLYQSP